MVYEVIFVKYNIVMKCFDNYLDALVECNKYNWCMKQLFMVRERRI